MARQARKQSTTGVYHVLLRANAYIDLFRDEEDTEVYMHFLQEQMGNGRCTIYAVSLHDKFVHILLKEGTDKVGMTVKRLASNYSYYYNVKYEHYGPMYNDRYKSEPIETTRFFERVVDHILSHEAMRKEQLNNTIPSLPDNNSQDLQTVLDFTVRPKRIIDSRLLEYLTQEWNYSTMEEFQNRPHEEQNKVIAAAKKKGASNRQLLRFMQIGYVRITQIKAEE